MWRRRMCVAVLGLCSFRAWASEADALAISQIIQARHLPYGTIIDPVYASPAGNQIVEYTRCGDSAIWTGHYLAAEAFRYQVTGAPEALTNIQGAIAGIQTLIDVTGTGLLARCRFPVNSPYAASIIGEESHNGIHTDSTGTYNWVGNTSRDQYAGVFFGLAVAYDMVGDAATQASIATLVTRLLDFLRGNLWNVIVPGSLIPSTTFLASPDEQMSFMYVGLHVNPQHYAGDPEFTSNLITDFVPAPIAVDVTSNSSYFKFNLDNISLYNLVRLDTSSNLSTDWIAYNLLWNHVQNQQNAFFNMINRALTSPNAARDSATVSMLDEWLQRPPRDVYVDLTGLVPSCGSGDACDPIPVPQRPTTDFLWQRDPYQLAGGGQGTIEGAGIDYILPYWMARYYGIETSAAVVNAATSGTSTSAESIASFYGPDLASGTAPASGVPLPLSLAGTTVAVRDSAGVSRSAALFYVSPTQINFEIPAGTALGQAHVTASGSSSTVTTTMVAAVSPGLFAAATLLQNSQEYLVLYGTGIRGRSSLSNVTVVVNGINLAVTYAGPQGVYSGLDQVNVMVPSNLSGTASAPLTLTVDGQTANVIQVAIP